MLGFGSRPVVPLRLDTHDWKWRPVKTWHSGVQMGNQYESRWIFFKICHLLMSEIVDLQSGKSANPSSRCNSGCFSKGLKAVNTGGNLL